MGSVRLKTSIGIYLVVFLFLAGVSINFVIHLVVQRDFVNAKVLGGQWLLREIADQLIFSETGTFDVSDRFVSQFLDTAASMGWEGLGVTDGEGHTRWWGAGSPSEKNQMVEIATRARELQAPQKVLSGETWGVFGKQHRNLFVSAPLEIEGRVVGGACLAFNLEQIYRHWRQSQKVFFLYILGNCAFLTFFGVLLFSKLIFKPLQKLVYRANEFRPGSENLYFLKEGKKNEFGKLSAALNQMLRRISQDQEKLQKTVQTLKKANLEIQAAQSQLVQAEKLASVGQLAAGVAHEIGNPIGIVLGYLGLLRDREIPEKERLDFLDRAEKEIQRVSIIIRQLLDHARTSAAKPAPLAVHDLIREIVDVFNLQPLTADLIIDCRLEARRDEIFADGELIRQVILNLMMNAADAIFMSQSPAMGKITIRSSQVKKRQGSGAVNSEWLSIEISDNGIGISAENLAKIFDPFFSTKDPGKGTGLGLAVSYQIIQNVGGEIRVESAPGKGTQFELLLPLSEIEYG
jgi:two-component system, NtrC family, sensor kinase